MAEVAEGFWIDSALVPDAANLLADLVIQVGDIDGLLLARYEDGVITVDADAAGNGWFIDKTPLDQAEFEATKDDCIFTAVPGDEADGRIDLLTVLMHEMGNAMGLPDLSDPTLPGFLMSPILATGMRRLPSEADVQGYAGTTQTQQQTGPVGQQGLANPNPSSSPTAAGGSGTGQPSLLSTDPGPLTNGRFNAGLTGWEHSGDASVVDGEAVLTESSRLLKTVPILPCFHQTEGIDGHCCELS